MPPATVTSKGQITILAEVRAALRDGSASGSFVDAVIACRSHSAGCTGTVTFDRLAAAKAGMTLLK